MHDDTFLTALTGCFDAHEEQLRAVALRIAGAPAEAEEALAAVRAGLGRDGGAAVRAWLTAAVGRECLRGLRERAPAGGRYRAEEARSSGREGDGVAFLWLALPVVLEGLRDDERLAWVLHDGFGLPPHETARVLGVSPETAARLVRRARERIRGRRTPRGAGRRERAVMDRFMAGVRTGDHRVMGALLAPDAVARSDAGTVHGAAAVAEVAVASARRAEVSRPALVDGAVGAVAFVAGRPVSAFAATLRRNVIVALSVTVGEDRVRALDLAFPGS
ncbi:sigma factor-like helix-turn-helix DNA-binding protein [Streptomyces sp. NPDC058872]|uniref:sigma factor-like helix-turn-helix DNA-binding protein n=1 Tax=Streptomyces sp. NPDC058872 TaxID=3346661 RepID=UPI0036ABAF98